MWLDLGSEEICQLNNVNICCAFDWIQKLSWFMFLKQESFICGQFFGGVYMVIGIQYFLC